jgi:hypothetical protein
MRVVNRLGSGFEAGKKGADLPAPWLDRAVG